MASDIVIISGTAAACELAKNGVSVTLVERGDLATEGETRHPIAPFARARLDAMTAREGVTLFG